MEEWNNGGKRKILTQHSTIPLFQSFAAGQSEVYDPDDFCLVLYRDRNRGLGIFRFHHLSF